MRRTFTEQSGEFDARMRCIRSTCQACARSLPRWASRVCISSPESHTTSVRDADVRDERFRGRDAHLQAPSKSLESRGKRNATPKSSLSSPVFLSLPVANFNDANNLERRIVVKIGSFVLDLGVARCYRSIPDVGNTLAVLYPGLSYTERLCLALVSLVLCGISSVANEYMK